jgi:N-acetylmuramoyl-L-alanine amidase
MLGISLAVMGASTPNENPLKPKEMANIVILDAGHGGIHPITKQYVTKGKRSTILNNVYYEGVGNRDVVKRAAELLNKKGVDTLFTVAPDNYKDVSLSQRVKIANKHYLKHNKKPFLISVHSNGYKHSSAHGTEVFTSPGTTKSDSIATIWMEEFNKLFPDIRKRTDFDDGDIDKEAKFTIITKTKCPAILIESMFHTNKKECEILASEAGRQKIAQVICNTVLRV